MKVTCCITCNRGMLKNVFLVTGKGAVQNNQQCRVVTQLCQDLLFVYQKLNNPPVANEKQSHNSTQVTIIMSRVVTKISSCRVNTTSRRGIKQLGISFGSIFLLFSNKSSRGPLSQQPGKIPGPRLLMTTLYEDDMAVGGSSNEVQVQLSDVINNYSNKLI